MTATLVPIFVGCILPIAVVAIMSVSRIMADKEKARIIIKAIESGNIDTDKLVESLRNESLRKPAKTPREILNLRLLRGCIFTLVGFALMIVGLVNFASGTGFGSDPVTVPMLFGGASAAVGISYLIVYFVTRKEVR